MNGRFPIAIHILTLLDTANGELLSSEYMAGSINVNPVLVRKEIINLRKHGLISSKEGKTGGYSLAKPAGEIMLSDVYLAVNQASVLGSAKNKPNPACPVGKKIGGYLEDLNDEMDKVVLKKLSTITLAAFSKQFE